jgi:hypothetical protein
LNQLLKMVKTWGRFNSQPIFKTVRRPLALVGMVKASENSEHALLFSPGGCEEWVELPAQAISEVQMLGFESARITSIPEFELS